ncbi:hypothetical protein [Sagittula stellata]|uniref:Uncharacterized protein n=1 Tax=Sagittula stellata (strain ATCC 700073 / DSM 11524 / E-37) TaxID=388399 RepID=A3K374_SAGS3|nr:hypothetical protein [Sagittula stellata]EBA08633.1 hypothetical protein SSE37_17513 [Sagittula stellata E-37]
MPLYAMRMSKASPGGLTVSGFVFAERRVAPAAALRVVTEAKTVPTKTDDLFVPPALVAATPDHLTQGGMTA